MVATFFELRNLLWYKSLNHGIAKTSPTGMIQYATVATLEVGATWLETVSVDWTNAVEGVGFEMTRVTFVIFVGIY